MSTLNETIKDIDSKKKQLQETVDSLNDQIEMLKMQGKLLLRTVFFVSFHLLTANATCEPVYSLIGRVHFVVLGVCE